MAKYKHPENLPGNEKLNETFKKFKSFIRKSKRKSEIFEDFNFKKFEGEKEISIHFFYNYDSMPTIKLVEGRSIISILLTPDNFLLSKDLFYSTFSWRFERATLIYKAIQEFNNSLTGADLEYSIDVENPSAKFHSGHSLGIVETPKITERAYDAIKKYL